MMFLWADLPGRTDASAGRIGREVTGYTCVARVVALDYFPNGASGGLSGVTFAVESGVGCVEQQRGLLFPAGETFLLCDQDEKIGIFHRARSRIDATAPGEPGASEALQSLGKCPWVVLCGTGTHGDDGLRDHMPVL